MLINTRHEIFWQRNLKVGTDRNAWQLRNPISRMNYSTKISTRAPCEHRVHSMDICKVDLTPYLYTWYTLHYKDENTSALALSFLAWTSTPLRYPSASTYMPFLNIIENQWSAIVDQWSVCAWCTESTLVVNNQHEPRANVQLSSTHQKQASNGNQYQGSP